MDGEWSSERIVETAKISRMGQAKCASVAQLSLAHPVIPGFSGTIYHDDSCEHLLKCRKKMRLRVDLRASFSGKPQATEDKGVHGRLRLAVKRGSYF
jgi:hypothetical protein